MKIEFRIRNMFSNKFCLFWMITPIRIDFDAHYYKIGFGSGNLREHNYPIRKLFKEAKVARKKL